MEYMSEREYDRRLREIKIENESIKRTQSLKEEKNKYKKKKKLPSTSKLIAVYLFIILNVILGYAMFVMYRFQDLSCLGLLITDVVGQVLTFLIYARKSTIENSKNGIVYDMAMANLNAANQEETINDEAKG